MSVEVKLFGKLKEYVSQAADRAGHPFTSELGAEDAGSVLEVLDSLGIEKGEISHVFVNGEYSGVKKQVSDGDRVAIFPKDMGLLYKWYFSKEE